jgi:hypothetical protein
MTVPTKGEGTMAGRSWVRLWRVAAAASVAFGFAALGVGPAPVAQAKDWQLAGTVECGQRSGNGCFLGNTVGVWTEDISGSKQLATVDISWVRRRFPAVDQGDSISLEVRDMPGGVLQAISVTATGQRVNRLDFGGTREEYNVCNDSIDAGVGRARQDDERLANRGVRRCADLRD